MADGAFQELFEAVGTLQEVLLARQRELKTKPHSIRPLDASASLAILLDALDAVAEAELDSLERLEKQTRCLTSLALLFALVRLEEIQVPEGPTIKSLEAAWSHWPPAGAGIASLRCRELVNNIIRLSVIGQTVVERLLCLCLGAPLGTKRVLACLQALLDANQHGAVERRFPCLIERNLDLLCQEDGSTQASRLCVTMIAARISPQSDDFGELVSLLEEALCRESGNDRQKIASHLLPLLVKSRPKFFRALYVDFVKCHCEHLDIFLALARTGFAAGLLRRDELPDELLKASMRHSDARLRSAVIVLLSDAPSTALRLTDVDLEILGDLFQYDMGPTDGDFRQATGAAWMRLLTRIRTSSYAANRNASSARKMGTRDKSSEAYVITVKAFLAQLVAELKKALLSLSPYRVQRGALQYLGTMLASGLDPVYVGELDKAAQKSLSQFKTQPGSGPLWPFELHILDASMTRNLLRCLLSTYDDVRDRAFSLLVALPAPVNSFFRNQASHSDLLCSAMALLRNRRESETVSGALLAEMAARLDDEGFSVVLQEILSAAEEDMALAQQDLPDAARKRPMHGCLIGIRQIYIAYPLSLPASFYARVLRLCEGIWAVVQPILCHASPEGMVMDNVASHSKLADHEDARALFALQRGPENGGGEDDADDEDNAAGPGHKILLSAAWRSAKEVAALLEACVLKPIAANQLHFAWTQVQIEQIGNLFATWLLQIRHRGAFSAIHPSYERVCRALVEYGSWPEAQAIPLELLHSHLKSIRQGHISITRRSAGLPYCILGALSAVRAAVPQAISDTMTYLLEVAESGVEAETSRVHAINSLMILIGDAELSPVLKAWVEPCFALALRSFASTTWNVRNVSMLLFASLVQRVLGTRASPTVLKKQHGSKGNQSHDFFRRYPSLRSLFLRVIDEASQRDLNKVPTLDMQSALHAILLLLGLLSTPYRTDEAHEICISFLPYLGRCASSRVWRIREAAAEALAALMPPGGVAEYLQGFSTTELIMAQGLTNNQLHGRLLQILVPLQRVQPVFTDLLDWPHHFDAAALGLMRSRPSSIQETVFLIVSAIARLERAPSPSAFAPLLSVEALKMLQSASHGSKTESALLICAEIALLNGKGDVTSLLLASSFDAVVNLGLKACKDAATPANAIDQLMEVAQSSRSQQNRSLAQQLLKEVGCAAGEESFSRLLKQYESTNNGTTRLSLLLLLAEAVQVRSVLSSQGQILIEAQTEAESLILCNILAHFVDANADEEARRASTTALAALPPAYRATSAYQALRMQVLQDDDPLVRDTAERLGPSPTPEHSLRQVEDCTRKISVSLGAEEMLCRFLLPDIGDLFDALQQTDEALFARERANLYKDDGFEADMLIAAARQQPYGPCYRLSKGIAELLPRLRKFLFARGNDLASPFGIASKPAFGLLSLKLSGLVAFVDPAIKSEVDEVVQLMIRPAGL